MGGHKLSVGREREREGDCGVVVRLPKLFGWGLALSYSVSQLSFSQASKEGSEQNHNDGWILRLDSVTTERQIKVCMWL